jgi:hypothetical protein
MSVLLVGGACLLLQGITTQPTDSVDVIILEMLGSQERTLVFHSPVADKIRRIIREIGKRHGLTGSDLRQAHQHCQAMLALLCCMQHRSALIRLLVILEVHHAREPLVMPFYSQREPKFMKLLSEQVEIDTLPALEAITFSYRFFGPFIHRTKSRWYPCFRCELTLG